MGARSKRVKAVITAIYAVFFSVYLYIGFQPVEAASYESSGILSIPSISLTSEVAKLSLQDGQLMTPRTIPGSYSKSKTKTLIIGHSTTIFSDLESVKIGDTIEYKDEKYIIYDIKTMPKESIDMAEVLKRSPEKTIIIMTCAGEPIGNLDATHRLLVYAKIEK